MKNIDNNIKVLIAMLCVVLVLFLANAFINKNNKIDYTNKEYIEIKGENIPSIYKLIGNKKILEATNGTDNTGNYIEITYQDLSIIEIADYFTYFRENNYVLISSDENNAVIATESNDSGKIITITANFLNDKTKIKYSKGNGTLTRE